MVEARHACGVSTGYFSVKHPLQKPQAACGARWSSACVLRKPKLSAPVICRISSTEWWQAMRFSLSGMSVPK